MVLSSLYTKPTDSANKNTQAHAHTLSQRERKRERDRDRQTDRKKDRQTERQTETENMAA